jgi:hypothetical protein
MKRAARAGTMRFLFAILTALALTSCASSDDDRFRVGSSPRSFVIIGVAEAAANTSASYDLLWRRLDAAGGFTPLDDDTAILAETNERGSMRIRGIPGEFTLREVEPGAYALDSVFGVLRDDRVNYIANGLITGPERPAFEVRPGEAVFLGIWQVDLEDNSAVTRQWRLSEADLRAVLSEQDNVLGDVRMRETVTRAVACAPRRMNNQTQRQVC